ncbi:hypothetical protein [Nocardioides sp. 616]|uniref:hypothetical protein n=1 Tax=Nocardioides sp. 616 TaxID=2268090 RepID=UPI0013B38281|nr:hypothetical protein [Nocardioides sp. 616]
MRSPSTKLYAASVSLFLALAATVLVAPGASAAPAATVQGTVTVPATFFPDDVTVSAYENVGAPDSPEWQQAANVWVEPDGSYTVPDLAPGTYRLGFQHPGLVEEFYDDVTDVEQAQDITVGDGDVAAGYDAELVRGGEIFGTLTLASAAPQVEVYAYLYQWNAAESRWASIDWSFVDADGGYAFDPRTDGTYRVGFNDDSGTHADEFYDDAARVEDAKDVVVTNRGDVQVDAELALSGHIMGRVTGPDGLAVPETQVTVNALVRGAWVPVAWAYSDADGFYDVGRLLAGTYRLQFDDWSDNWFELKFYPNAATIEEAGDVTVTAGSITPTINVTLGTPVDGYVPPTDEPTTPPAPPAPVPPTPTVQPTPTTIGFGTPAGTPVAKGTAKVGKTLKAIVGTVTPATAKVKIQWFANGKKIKKATKATFKITGKYAGKKIHATVTATAPGYKKVVAKTKAKKVKGAKNKR